MHTRQETDRPLQEAGADSTNRAQLSRGRARFFAIVAAALLLELAVLNVSVTTVVRLVLTSGLLFATWVGHGWARLTLVVGYCFGIVAAILLGVNGLDSVAGPLKQVVFGVILVIFAVSAWTFQFSTDLRSYLEVEKFPRPSDSRESERDG
jgi:hypothetical protein